MVVVHLFLVLFLRLTVAAKFQRLGWAELRTAWSPRDTEAEGDITMSWTNIRSNIRVGRSFLSQEIHHAVYAGLVRDCCLPVQITLFQDKCYL